MQTMQVKTKSLASVAIHPTVAGKFQTEAVWSNQRTGRGLFSGTVQKRWMTGRTHCVCESIQLYLNEVFLTSTPTYTKHTLLYLGLQLTIHYASGLELCAVKNRRRRTHKAWSNPKQCRRTRRHGRYKKQTNNEHERALVLDCTLCLHPARAEWAYWQRNEQNMVECPHFAPVQ